ncbi:hypothetical protein V3470_13715 [Flavobacterium oreochromis]|uniref:Uncharacterized protein n=1 Tax=Flavobacterium oreochromis TaxID=2906078 RepID=A0ABW8PBV3_9FLAO|nr:hypothetical protein [Flavobacterium oreochromis]OWP75193.1 hypothetical protein BWG23_11675 [Flavobacterium oreochromis]
MSKNNEIIAEIIAEEVNRFEKLISQQQVQNQVFASEILKIKEMEKIKISTKELEHVIKTWNSLFENQRQHILNLQKNLNNNNKKHLFYHRILIAILIVSIFILIIKN